MEVQVKVGENTYIISNDDLKQLGLGDHFRHLFGNIYLGWKDGVYMAENGRLRLLARNAMALKVHISEPLTCPEEISRLEKKMLSTRSGKSEAYACYRNLDAFNADVLKEAFVVETAYPQREELYVKTADGYVQKDVMPIRLNDKWCFFSQKGLYVHIDGAYVARELKPVVISNDYLILWAGQQDLLYWRLDKQGGTKLAPRLNSIGKLKALIETDVCDLIEVETGGSYHELWQVGQTIEKVASTPFENGFEIDRHTGKIVCHGVYSAVGFGITDSKSTFAFKNGHYEKV